MNIRKQQCGFSSTLIMLVVAIVAIIVSIGIYIFANKSNNKASKNTVPAQTTAPPKETRPIETPVPDPYAGWKTYTDDQNSISFKYPPSWSVESVGGITRGLDPSDLYIVVNFNSDQKYKTALEIVRHTNDIKKVSELFDGMYANASMSVEKTNSVLKGKQAIVYDVSNTPLPHKTYLFEIGDKTLSFDTGTSDNYLQANTPDFQENYSKTFNSLVIK